MIITTVLVTCLVAILGVFQQVSLDLLLNSLAHWQPSLPSFTHLTHLTSTSLASLLLVTGLDMHPASDAAPLFGVDTILSQLQLNASIGDGFASPDLNYDLVANYNLTPPHVDTPLTISERAIVGRPVNDTIMPLENLVATHSDKSASQIWWHRLPGGTPMQIAIVLLVLLTVNSMVHKPHTEPRVTENSKPSDARCRDAAYECMQREVAFALPRIHMLSKEEADSLAVSRKLLYYFDMDRVREAAEAHRESTTYDPLATMTSRPRVREELDKRCPTPPMAYVPSPAASTGLFPVVLPANAPAIPALPTDTGANAIRASLGARIRPGPHAGTSKTRPGSPDNLRNVAVSSAPIIDTIVDSDGYCALEALVKALPANSEARAFNATELDSTSPEGHNPARGEITLEGVTRDFYRLKGIHQKLMFDEEVFVLGRLYNAVLHTTGRVAATRLPQRALKLVKKVGGAVKEPVAVGEG
ncbi:hypothetical protein C2E23DRAFT_295 [Lenzites betulinus]|nr:hypothetical protein C2E23DRAFT_295 [Lenzites betulinus]